MTTTPSSAMRSFRRLTALAGAIACSSTILDAQSFCGSAHLVPIPSASSSPGTRLWLHGLDALGPSDLWAVGTRTEPVGTQTEGFSYVLRGDGQTWTEIQAPSPAVAPGFRNCELFAVEGASASDVYAAGWKLIAFPNNGHLGPQIFVLHWDGSTWSEIAAPIPYFSYMASSSGSRVLDIEVLAPNDIWFFGWWSGDEVSSAQPLALHYDGRSFTRSDTPLPLTRREIVSAKAFGSSDIWAIGRPTFGGTASPSTYAIHWDGQSWSQIQLFLSPFYGYDLASIDGMSSNDFWIAGYEALWPSGSPSGFALHFNGASFVKYPLLGIPRKLVAVSTNEVWAFGTTIERWNGASWTLVDDLASSSSGQLRGADAVGPCDLWAAGTQWLPSLSTVFPLGARVEPITGAGARVRPPCSGTRLPSCFLAVQAPLLGADMVLSLDDPAAETGLAPGAVFTWWMLASRPSQLAPCGIPLAGFGPFGGAAELLIDPGAGLTIFGPVAWTSAGRAALHRARVPNLPYLYGQTVYAQGLFTSASAAVLTSGLDLRIGR